MTTTADIVDPVADTGTVPRAGAPAGRARKVSSGRGSVLTGGGIIVLLIAAGYLLPLPHDPEHPYIDTPLAPPNGDFWLGTDSFGYDVFSRVVAAARTDIPIALAAVLIAAVIGSAIGLAVSTSSRSSAFVMRCVDISQCLPVTIVAVVVASGSGGSATVLILAIALINVPLFVRSVRAGALTVRTRPFVESASALGVHPVRIAVRHVLPNVLHLVLAQLSISLGLGVIAVATLSYLGVGVSITTPTWGGLVSDGADLVASGVWWVLLPAVAAITLTVLCCNLVADGVQRLLAREGTA
ncbi:ABC transporter permease [Nocardia jinanensis]|uniref:ABC transporter permease n=1 Tax=Nocardia jinanensis TaxID=382504 RepID=A0A917VMI1_9NOCA|nr:ABC transporter permease [Nocardia jinanensis]GGK99046.1 ABC transporter permease [Nocardia jinanensis]